MALGVLTKGPVALALPLLVAAPWAAWRRRSRAVWQPLGVGLFLLLVLPWVVAVEQRQPGFLRYVALTETWARLTSDELGRSEPLWYFAPFLLGGTFPWVVAVAVAGWERVLANRRSARERDDGAAARSPRTGGGRRAAVAYLVLWMLLPLLLLSLSQSKRPHYLLPLVPALALLTAWAWTRERAWQRGVRLAGVLLVLAGGALIALGVVDRDWAADPPSVEIGRRTAVWLGSVALGSGALAWLVARGRVLAVVALSLPLAALPALTAPLLAEVARVRSGKELAAVLRPHLERGVGILGIETYSPSLALYLDRELPLASENGEALRSNYVVWALRAGRLRTAPTLLPRAAWREALGDCPTPTLFLLETRDRALRAELEAAGLPVVFDGLLLDVLGPCQAAGAAPRTDSGHGR
jgi:4-amino-4-deoxy-L-arabinose transferase-like glycosyltransferase